MGPGNAHVNQDLGMQSSRTSGTLLTSLVRVKVLMTFQVPEL